MHPGDNKQSVPLALSIFDATTSAALQNYFPDKKDAAMFLKLINLWWVMSNSKTQFNMNHHSGDAAKKFDHKPEFFRALAQWVSDWTSSQTSNSQKFTLSKQTSSALITTLKCTASLIEDLLREGYSYVLTARFQTDPLELRFSKYRQMSGGRFLVGLREVKISERILSIKSLLKESISIGEEDIYLDNDDEPRLQKLQKQLEEMSEEISDCCLEKSSVEVVTVIAGYVTKKISERNSCFNCRSLMTISNSVAQNQPENNYLLTLSRGGLLIPATELVNYACKSFAILETSFQIIRESKIAERKAAEKVLQWTNSEETSFLCHDHPNSMKFINRTIANVFFNNWQKLEKDKVRHDAVKDFKHRRNKRLRSE